MQLIVPGRYCSFELDDCVAIDSSYIDIDATGFAQDMI